MKLNVKHKSKLTKTPKQKKKTEEKKKKGPKLSKNYKDTSDFICDKASIDMTQMKYGVISSCTLIAVELEDGIINLDNSWLEIILIMLSKLIEDKGDKAVQLLADNEVTNQFIYIDKVYGKYTFDSQQYKAYKIFNTGYYLEAIFTVENIFNVIYGLLKLLDIPLDKIQFIVVNKKNKEEKLNFDCLEDIEYIVELENVASNIKSGIHLVEISVDDEIVRVHILDAALVAICNYLYDHISEDKLVSKLGNLNTGKTGICRIDDAEDKQYVRLKQSSLVVYTDNESESIVEFLKEIKELFSINIRFKFRALKDKSELKEWEVE